MPPRRNGREPVLVLGRRANDLDEVSAGSTDVDENSDTARTVAGSDGLVRLLERESSLGPIESAGSASEALDRLATDRVSCVVVADAHAESDSLDRCRRIREEHPDVPVVYVPTDGSERIASEALSVGLTGYVPSDASRAELLAEVRRVAGTAVAGGTETGAGDTEPADPDANDTDAAASGNDRTRTALERELSELRASEELHRVTLNHMTDTVLITDDEGAFTYVCPNVHFIFGYTDEEIREMGTIDALLEPGLIDRERLAAEGVLTNVECRATDKDGREHALLVNAREVDIQGGTVLYSCRDVTTRKRREDALTALHRTVRRLVYAETASEIADVVIEDAADVLDLEASAVFRFEDGTLQPTAHSSAMERLCGPPSTFRVNGENAVGFSYLERASFFLGDVTDDGDDTPPAAVQDASLPANPSTDVESAAYVALGEHGVFVAGSESTDRFDEVTRELAELLAAAAEAALDRVDRESALRERDRELQRQNRRLTRLNLINEIIREIDGALVRAETREEIERAVCRRLTGEDRFSFAWIGAPSPGGTELEIRAMGGDGVGYLDAVSLPLAGGTEPACLAGERGEVSVVSNVADRLHEESWRSAALARDYQSVISVPLSYDEFTYGVLTVYADRPEAFDEVSRPVIEELGETISSAMGAIERKSALLTASSTRLEFDVRDEVDPFCLLAREADCTITFDGGVRQSADGTWVFATVDGASADAVAALARDLVAVEAAQAITDDETGGTIRIRLSEPFVALRLADHGVVCRRIEATPDGARLVLDVPTGVDSRASVRVVEAAYEEVSLVSKGTVERSSPRDLPSVLLDRLTDRQFEVVQVAYYGGYFESPRASTGEEVAEALGISPAAFYRHTRTVQRKLFEAVFDEIGVSPTAATGVE